VPARFTKKTAIRREIGDQNGIAMSLNNLGALATDRCDFHAARACMRRVWPSRTSSGIGSRPRGSLKALPQPHRLWKDPPVQRAYGVPPHVYARKSARRCRPPSKLDMIAK
jgi:hypothetical protein